MGTDSVGFLSDDAMTSNTDGVALSQVQIGTQNNMSSNPIRRDMNFSEGSNQITHGQITEIRHEDSTSGCLKSKDGKPPTVPAYIVNVKPAQCSTVVKQLAIDLPLGFKGKSKNNNFNSEGNQDSIVDLSHLKRVHRRSQAVSLHQDSVSVSDGCQDSSGEPPAKKKKQNAMELRILVGAVSVIDQRLSDGDNSNCDGCSDNQFQLQAWLESYGPTETILVPSRPPSSRDEWQEWNDRWWPTIYSPLSWQEHREEQLAIKPDELQQMRRFVNHVLHARRSSVNAAEEIPRNVENLQYTDNCNERNTMGSCCDTQNNVLDFDLGCAPAAIVVDPISDKVVASSWLEEEMQQQNFHQSLMGQTSTSLLVQNPLVTPIMLALQGVSRLERNEVIRASDEHSRVPAKLQHQQYLCTGYDLYTTHEPNVAEAMACVHSRLRRLIFLFSSPPPSGSARGTHLDSSRSRPSAFQNGCSTHFVHCLPGTNHKYRAFRFQLGESHATKAEQT